MVGLAKSSTLPMPSFQFHQPEFFSRFSELRSWEPGWLVDFRKDCWEAYARSTAQKSKDERWRFSPRSRFSMNRLESLAENGESLSVESGSSDPSIALSLLDRLILDEPHSLVELAKIEGPCLGADDFQNLTGAYAESGYVVRAKESNQAGNPIVIEHHEPASSKIAFHHNLIVLEDNVELFLIEKFVSSSNRLGGTLSNLLKVRLGSGARLHRLVLQNFSDQGTLVEMENFEIGKDASLHSANLHLGGAQTRVESKGVLRESGSHFAYGSVFVGKNEGLLDQRTLQVHAAPHCTSDLLCKNVLRNHSKSVFSGLIKVEEKAQFTDAYQTNRNLLLDPEAKADSLPGLEILANEVKCSHGATTSRINPQELFYLQSRGLPQSLSQQLIALGFMQEVLDGIANEELRALARSELDKSFTS